MEKIIRSVIITGLTLGFTNVKSQQHETIEVNNLKVGVKYTGHLFTSQSGGPGFEAPAGSGIHACHGSFLWVGGLDDQNIKLAVNSYNRNDFQSGPYLTDGNEYANTVTQWERLWKVSKTEIDDHIQNHGNSGYVTPASILEWPVHGINNVNNGFHDNYLAPFIDANFNGIYEPELGDYPDIKKADEAIWFILNDDKQNVNSTSKIGIEVSVMVYAYSCSEDNGVNNSIFVDYNIKKKSVGILNETYVGFYNDFDIGAPSNDFIGCDVSTSTVYGYTGNGYDADNNGINGYLDQHGSLGMTILKGATADANGMDNYGANWYTPNVDCSAAIDSNGVCYPYQAMGYSDGIIDNETLPLQVVNDYGNQSPNPSNNLSFYAALSNCIQSPIYPNTSIPTNHLYPANSDPLGYAVNGVTSLSDWTEATQGNSPGETRIIGSMGPFTLSKNDKQEIETAYVFARDIDAIDNFKPVEIMLERVQQVKLFHLNGNTCQNYNSIENSNKAEVEFSIYPNPFTSSFKLELNEINNDTEISIVNMLGKEVKQIITNQIETEINLSKYSSGIYFVKVKQGDVISTKKILKH